MHFAVIWATKVDYLNYVCVIIPLIFPQIFYIHTKSYEKKRKGKCQKMNGPKVLFEIPLFGGIKVTESIVNMWIIMAALVIVSVWLTHGMRVRNPSKKQLVAEKTHYNAFYNLVKDTMGEKYMSFAPYIGTLFIFSIVGSLSSLTGLRPITADLSVILSWSIVTFLMIQVTNIKKSRCSRLA